MRLRRRSALRGVVQGVGFRPHVARIASRYRVTGFCGNDDESVFIEAQGEAREVECFLDAVVSDLPPLARIVSRDEEQVPVIDDDEGFRIVASRSAPGALTLVPPDIAVCEDCLREMADPGDRRYGYPLINCTNCGPRFAIIVDLPYDRASTTLARFAMCAECAAEYDDPTNRRFHAEPTSCFACGPRLWLETADGEVAQWDEAIEQARRILADGGVVAVKGLGGFMLMCNARDDVAVERLRTRKRRPAKPFAVMTADVSAAARFADLGDEHQRELASPQRPIVLAPLRAGSGLAPAVAPGLDQIGVMLPSAPVHALLVKDDEVVVATSANRSGEPLCYRNESVLEALGGIADAFLLNDRDIHVPVEDSVLLADDDCVLPIRRSRGFAPLPIALTSSAGPSVLAVGGELKSTFTLTRDRMAFVSAHIGDMGSLAAQGAFERSVDQLVAAHRCAPALLVADAHPGYHATAWAQRRGAESGTPVLHVQHHHAHALSLLAEHGAVGRSVLCLVLDGTGYGGDGTIWGGELLRVEGSHAERVWHLPEFALPGGDSAVSKPWKSAVALLAACGCADEAGPSAVAADPAELAVVRGQLRTGIATVPTTSAGRLFDAVASLLGIRHTVSFEAQAAMELECAARRCAQLNHRVDGDLDVPALISDLLARRNAGEPVACLARRFHIGFVHLIVRAVVDHLDGAQAVGLTGGVFQNRILVGLLMSELRRRLPEVPVLTHRVVPANDGGLSLGQAVAGHLLLSGKGEARCA
ncbi:carbamoyltransferase HypF [Gordonia sp. PP30]|uniref:carbamoyltransferase HypF n=1 Tax=Gordonia sp. PP30 TaxID=2935861 RepID=UPI001FFFC8DC|nr:carbamoyltransferase HypF [Gordonia sp. PP30]UQE76474.1 carbamoyltransferase HypF [Gordonia sp. PP30]